jgi:pimeloyl-ACP methyl ester carboxylesterase
VTLRIKRITDEEPITPTRHNIIEGFGFFSDAKAGDVCLFYYSGHGSFTAAPEEFWTERDGYLESFVCLDSRMPGGRDLTNKEMGYLIARTLEGKPAVDFVAITDCCHSGTITKAMAESKYIERSMPADYIPRNIDSYYGYGSTINGKSAYEDETKDGKRKVTVQQAPHIHLAASQENQTAKERIIDGQQNGAFTYSLLKTLYAHKGQVSYQKLMASAAVQVANLVQQQAPVFNLNGGLKEEEQKRHFLSDTTDTTFPSYKVYWNNKAGWCIGAGAIHGASVGDSVIIATVGETKIIDQYAPDFSVLISKPQFGGKENEYEAKLIPAGANKVKVAFGENVQQSLKDLLQAAYQKLRPAYAEFIDSSAANYFIRQNDQGVFITLPAAQVPVFDYSTVNTEPEAERFLEKVAAVANWWHLLEINNPSSQLSDSDYTITIKQKAEAGNDDPNSFINVEDITKPVELYYLFDGAKWGRPAIQLTLTNTSAIDLWCSCLYMDFDYSISGAALKEVLLPPGKPMTLNMLDKGIEKNVIPFLVTDEFLQKGYNDITTYLKFFISKERINTSSFSQDGLQLAAKSKSMLSAKGTRTIGSANEVEAISNDWITETIALRIVRPKQAVLLPEGGSTHLNGITVEAPNTFSAQLTVTSSSQQGVMAKSMATDTLNRLRTLQRFPLMPTTRSAPVMDVLELTEAQNVDAVNADSPLKIQLPSSREVEDSTVIPLGYDEQTGLYFPVGFVDAQNNVHIQQLPAPTAVSATITSKSLSGSIKIYFRKVVSDWFGLPNPYPRLAMADFASGKLEYKDDKEQLCIKVAEAKTIILIIHGIIGDTKSIANTYKAVLDEQGTTMKDAADLILTFDYENLKTSIKETASLLKSELAAIGLKEGHGKKLVIMAHSMGGLVARWFIEREGGAKVTSGLVMFGTPNMGTPWADVRDMAQAIITYAVNGAAFLQPWLFVLSSVGKLVKGTQITFQEMDAVTGIYKELNDGKQEPGIPYIIISGNTQQIVPDYSNTTSLLGRIFKKAKHASYQALDETLFKKPNDIAVSVDSVQGIPVQKPGRNRRCDIWYPVTT